MNFGEGDMAQPITPITQLEETVDQMTQQCKQHPQKHSRFQINKISKISIKWFICHLIPWLRILVSRHQKKVPEIFLFHLPGWLESVPPALQRLTSKKSVFARELRQAPGLWG